VSLSRSRTGYACMLVGLSRTVRACMHTCFQLNIVRRKWQKPGFKIIVTIMELTNGFRSGHDVFSVLGRVRSRFICCVVFL